MKKPILLAALAVIAIAMAGTTMPSCKKAADTPTDSSCATGTVKFTNNSDDQYSINIDGATTDVISARQILTKLLTKGSHSLGATQMTGFVTTPTERKTIITLNGCDTREFMFP